MANRIMFTYSMADALYLSGEEWPTESGEPDAKVLIGIVLSLTFE
ncbi:MAG: hypothetical protein RKH07_03600 [Gammaproteobacteria bacterium]